MFILNDILKPLQKTFSSTDLGMNRGQWFTYAILAFIIPFTTSISSNVLRSIQTLFGFNVNQRRFYTFMASNKLPWNKLWPTLWSMIPEPLTDGRLLIALDDFINPKTGKKIFGCSSIFDHAAKTNQSKYPRAQNVVLVGVLKLIKGRWACLPLAYRFYLPKKTIEAQFENMKVPGKDSLFQTKLEQAVEILTQLSQHFAGIAITVVCDSWFGNNGLFSPLRKKIGTSVNLLSRLRSNTALYRMPHIETSKKQGRAKKYGQRLGSCAELAAEFISQSSTHRVFLYGKYREVQAFSMTAMLKNIKSSVRVVWVFRKTQWVALFSTDRELSVEQIIEYYGARWKIESGFKEIKQDIGSSKTQTRNAHAVINHLNFSLMATTVVWIYGTRLEKTPERRHYVKGRNTFAFSDLRHIIAKAALADDFNAVCNKNQKLSRKSFVDALLRMVA